jgi:hypothetical protein
LFKLAGITLNLSSSYHLESDGQTESINQCLETFLRCFVQACPKKWKEWLPTAEFWYNNCFHSALGCSPFEALYDRQPRILGIAPPTAAKGQLDESSMTHTIREHLLHAEMRMKKQADKRRSERSFEVGTWVYMKLQPYVQSSVMARANQKLSFK